MGLAFLFSNERVNLYKTVRMLRNEGTGRYNLGKARALHALDEVKEQFYRIRPLKSCKTKHFSET